MSVTFRLPQYMVSDSLVAKNREDQYKSNKKELLSYIKKCNFFIFLIYQFRSLLYRLLHILFNHRKNSICLPCIPLGIILRERKKERDHFLLFRFFIYLLAFLFLFLDSFFYFQHFFPFFPVWERQKITLNIIEAEKEILYLLLKVKKKMNIFSKTVNATGC